MSNIHTPLDVKVVQKSFPEARELYLLPLGDLHWDSRYSNHSLIERKIQEIKENNYLTLLIGDTFDKLFFSWLLKDQQGDDLNVALIAVANLFKPIKNNILLIMDGNHERGMEKKVGFNMGEALANMLEVPFIRGMGVLHLRVGQYRKNLPLKESSKTNNSSRMNSYVGLIAHGYGGGRTKGAKANKAAALGDVMENCDFSIMGHVHDPNLIPNSRLVYDPQRKIVYAREIRNVILSAFQNYSNYAQESFMRPSPQLEYLMRFDGMYKNIEILERRM